jgi:hypothetical protein
MKNNIPVVGKDIYVDSSFSISHGSDDVVGGLAKVTKVTNSISGGEKCHFVEVAEHPGHSYNWDQHLANMQDQLKKEFGRKRAYADPDIDTPWIEDGDLVNGQVYHGKSIW